MLCSYSRIFFSFITMQYGVYLELTSMFLLILLLFLLKCISTFQRMLTNCPYCHLTYLTIVVVLLT